MPSTRPTRWSRAGISLLTIALLGCAEAPSTLPSTEPLRESGPPAGPFTRFEDVQVVDGVFVDVRFTGGPEFDPADPCSIDYEAWADVVDGELLVGIVTPGRGAPATPRADGVLVTCNAMGHPRSVAFELHQPFMGTTVRDLAGYTHFLEPPERLVWLGALPLAWILESEGDVEESPTGRWRRTWFLHGNPDHVLELYQSFGGPSGVSGGEEERRVDVRGIDGVLYRQPEIGELVLVWRPAVDGLALVANERDFAPRDLILLAESAR